MISWIRLRGNEPHLAWSGKPSGFSRCAAGALDVRRLFQGPALVASGKASPNASCSGASRDTSLSMPELKTFIAVDAGT